MHRQISENREEMEHLEAQNLAKQLESFTIDSLKKEAEFGLQNGENLGEFPPEVLANIFSYVGSNSFNKPPPEFVEYLLARNTKDFENRTAAEQSDWNEKVRREYAVRNLMLLRGVCTKFEDIINNEMVPGKNFDYLMIDIKFKGSEDCPRSVVFFKYGGTGSLHPCTRLRRIRRFNEIDYEHIQKFERIRNLYISDMVLTEELFETILRLDLTQTKKITFERIQDIKFNDSINIVNYIQNFLNTLNSPANVFFNSNVFDPDVVLFGVEEAVMEGGENFDIQDEIIQIEMGGKHHKAIRRLNAECKKSGKGFRVYRSINVVNNIIHSHQHVQPKTPKAYPYDTWFGQKKYKNKFMEEYDIKIKKQPRELRRCGKWHLKRVFEGMEHCPGRGAKSTLYHLKMLKKICGDPMPMTTEEEQSLIEQWQEADNRQRLMAQFPFLKQFPIKSRYYTAYSEIPR